jgi:hypothetical protein
MKKLLVISLALILSVGMCYGATNARNVSPGIGNIMGNGQFDSDPGKIFRLVRYNGGSSIGANAIALSVGSIVIWDTTTGDGVTVTTTTTSGDIRVAGLVVGSALLTQENGTYSNLVSADMGRRNWGFIQTYGKSLALWQTYGGGTSITGGTNHFGTSTQAGAANSFTQSATVNGIAGFTMIATPSAQADSSSVDVFLKGLD